MCRVVAYMGDPLPLDVLLFRSDTSLVRQAFDPKRLQVMNLAGTERAEGLTQTRTSDDSNSLLRHILSVPPARERVLPGSV